jgi:hypothetical protein
MLPNFICIGPARAGAGWLYEVLREHPEICMAKNIKETEFFTCDYDMGMGWYETYFSSCTGAKAVGEITNRYIFSPDVALRIHRHIPQCKIVVCLRNPLDRLISNYLFKVREGTLNCGFNEALQLMPQLLFESRYFHYLEPFYHLFPNRQFFYIDFQLLSQNPKALVRKLFEFLEVDADYQPTVLHRRINKSIVPRLAVFPMLTEGGAVLMRRIGIHRLLTELKLPDSVKWIFFRNASASESVIITDQIRSKLLEVISEDVQALEMKTGLRLRWLDEIRS